MPTTRDLELELDQRLQRYAAGGMSRAGMLAQLTLAGYPTELLQQRFPEMSAVAFGLAKPTAEAKPQGRAPARATDGSRSSDVARTVRHRPSDSEGRHEAGTTSASPQGESQRRAPAH